MICWQKSAASCVLFLICISPALSQTCATTELGRQVVLSEDGSWEYARGNECESATEGEETSSTTEVLIGSDRYPAGVRKIIIDDDFFEIKAQVVDKDGQAMLVLWHESNQQCHGTHYFGHPRHDPSSDSRLFLSNGTVIKFIDRGNKGRRTIKDARPGAGPMGMDVDICQQWIAYRLTRSEIDEIQKTEVSRIEIEAGLGSSSEMFRIRQNRSTLAVQSRALGL